MNLVSLNGGSKNNTIPREATAVVSIKSKGEKIIRFKNESLRENPKNLVKRIKT